MAFIIIMNFNNFVKCSEEHENDYEFCCLRDKKIFCSECWYKHHALRCPSSRCGHYEKLAHLVIDRVLEMKTLFYTSEMSSSLEKYKIFRNNIIRMKDFFVDNFKKEI